MANAKNLITASIDERLDDELKRVDVAMQPSTTRQRRRRNLLRFIDRLDTEHGPSDPADLAEFRELLS